MADYRLEHNCPPGTVVRIKGCDTDEAAIEEAERILASLQSEVPEDERVDVRARLVLVLRVW